MLTPIGPKLSTLNPRPPSFEPLPGKVLVAEFLDAAAAVQCAQLCSLSSKHRKVVSDSLILRHNHGK